MITYRIISKTQRQNTETIGVSGADPSTDAGRLRIFRKVLKVSKKNYRKGVRVRVKDTNIIGEIQNIRSDINTVNWEDGRPHFIEVLLNSNGTEKLVLAHPFQLQRIQT